MKKHHIYIIVAVDEKNGIGKKGKLPWHFKSDMAFFKNITTQTTDPEKQNKVIMGRKTWESLPKKFQPLPKRENVVITHSMNYKVQGAKTYHSLEKALTRIEKNIENIFIIGGAEIFRQAIGIKNLSGIYITKIHKIHNCDTFFPEIEGCVKKAKEIKTISERGTKISFLFARTQKS